MKRFITILILPIIGYAQIDTFYTRQYVDESTSFAWTTIGLDFLTLPGGTTAYSTASQPEEVAFGPSVSPRLTIGGMHFWGHADFYVTFPLNFLNIGSTPQPFSLHELTHGIETGAKFYPWKVKEGRISPFAGISFRPLNYRYELNDSQWTFANPAYRQMIYPLNIGATYTTANYHLNLSAYYQTLQAIPYYLSPDQVSDISLSRWSFQIGVLKYIDTDRSMRTPSALEQINLKHKILKNENKLNSWYIGIGPSAALETSNSPFIQNNFPYLENQSSGSFMPDITTGKYLYKPDLNIGLSYRRMGERMEAFDTQLNVGRQSLMMETYKFLFNYLGFVPFVGITGSWEWLTTEVNGTVYQENKPAAGFILGWDIRVVHTNTGLLRTNLRWTPDLHMTVEGEKMMFNHLEFNFIQYVHFIGRKKTYMKYRKN